MNEKCIPQRCKNCSADIPIEIQLDFAGKPELPSKTVVCRKCGLRQKRKILVERPAAEKHE